MSGNPLDFIEVTAGGVLPGPSPVQPPFTCPASPIAPPNAGQVSLVQTQATQPAPTAPAEQPAPPKQRRSRTKKADAATQPVAQTTPVQAPPISTQVKPFEVVDGGVPAGAPAVPQPSAAPNLLPITPVAKSVATDAVSAEIEHNIFGSPEQQAQQAQQNVQSGNPDWSNLTQVDDSELDLVEFDGEEQAAPAQQHTPAPTVQQAAAAQPVSKPAVIAIPAVVVQNTIAPTPSVPVPPKFPEATVGLFNKLAGQAELGDSAAVLKQLEEDAAGLWYHAGVALLYNPNNRDPANKVHDVIFTQRWQPELLLQMSPQKLCEYENLLSAHQVWMRSIENMWKARYEALGNELDRLCYRKRESYQGTTVAAKEGKMFEDDTNMRTLRLEYMRAWGMRSLTTDLGETFTQLENGLKRTITLVAEEYRQTRYSNGSR